MRQIYRNALATSPVWVCIGYLFITVYALETRLPFLPTLGLLIFAMAASCGIYWDMREREPME
jgi:hypothetical protein